MKKTLVLFAVLSLVFTGCLKTRSQVKNSEGDSPEDEKQAPPPPPAASKYEIEEIKHEVTRLSGKVEEMEHNQQQGQKESASSTSEANKALENRIAELEKNQILFFTELKELKEKQAAVKEAPANIDKLLADGHRFLKEKKYDEAIEKFKAVLNRSPKGGDAAEAYFGIGEAEFSQKNYKKSIVSFSKVQEASAKSTLVPNSLYRIGLAFQNLNMGKESRGFFAELVERYPKSPEAKKARARLKQ